jgi:hypothetical protein
MCRLAGGERAGHLRRPVSDRTAGRGGLPAELLVPTLPAFAASKTATWADRHAPRDLWDLWALSEIGAIDAAAAQLYCRFGPTNQPPGNYLFETPPPHAEWQTQLAGQTRLTITARQALDAVRDAWARLSS